MADQFEQLLAARDRLNLPGTGLDWIETMRRDNAQRFRELGLPTMRDEDWKYTSIKPITKKAFAPAGASRSPSPGDLPAFDIPDLDAHRIVLVDGHYAADSSDDGAPGEGVRACSLARAIGAGASPGWDGWAGTRSTASGR